MTKGSDTLYFTYDAAGTPMAFTHKTGNTETTYYYATNLQGDVIAILNGNGMVVAEYTYDAWGNSLGIDPNENDPDAAILAALNPLRYRGYVYDAETGLYYLQSRYYNPEIGRFINADDVVQLGANGDFASFNLYAYCGNNPISRIDVNGNSWRLVIALLKEGYALVRAYNYSYNSSICVSGYILNQNTGNAAMFKYGLFESSHNGCGWIATYNALIMLSDRTLPADIISAYEVNGAVAYGAFGTSKCAVASYFETRGYTVTVTTDVSQFDEVAKSNKANILHYWHSSGAHFVAVKWTDSYFYSLNTYNNSSSAKRFNSISGFLEDNGYNNATLFSIS